MDEVDEVDELGPVDWIVVEFPGSRFNGQIAPVLLDLVERDLIRVLDLLVLKKDADGSLEAFELSDLDEGEIGELRAYESELAMLLSEEDVTSLAAAIEPGSSAAVLVWENTWSAPFASAVRRAGGQLVAVAGSPSRPCSRQSRLMSKKKQPMRAARIGSHGRRNLICLSLEDVGVGGVIGPRPVARTAAIVGTAAVVAHGDNRRSDRRDDRGDRREDRRDDRGDRREDRRDRRF